jgi:three-Cys-motif partner protein
VRATSPRGGRERNTETVDRIIGKLPRGYHFAMLDPFGIKAMPFSIVSKLLAVDNLDLLIHVSKMSLERNLGHNLLELQSHFDHFFPPWRSH